MALRMWGQQIIQGVTPGEAPVMVGTLWVDTSGAPVLKACTSVSPYTFSALTGGGNPFDQNLNTTNSPTFAGLTVAGQLTTDLAGLRCRQVSGVDDNTNDLFVGGDGANSLWWTNWAGTLGMVSSVGGQTQLYGNPAMFGIGVYPTSPLHVLAADTSASAGSISAAFIDATYTPSADSTGTRYGLGGGVTLAGTKNLTLLRGLSFYTLHAGSGLLGNMQSLTFDAFIAGAGNVTNISVLAVQGSWIAGATGIPTNMLGGSLGFTFTDMPNAATVAGTIAALNLTPAFNLPAGRTLSSVYGAILNAPTGAGTITSFVGHFTPAISSSGPTYTNVPYAYYQIGAGDRNYFAGKTGHGTATPTALLHLGAGTATANTGPLKLTSGTVLGTPEVGSVEYNGRFVVTDTDGAQRHLVQADASTKTTAGAPYTNDGYVTVVINGTSRRLMTTA